MADQSPSISYKIYGIYIRIIITCDNFFW